MIPGGEPDLASNDELEPLYWVLNGLILALGIGLNLLGAHLRRRREARAAGPAHASTGA